MLPKKDILMTTATAVSTVGFAVSMILHFTPWPHRPHNSNKNHTGTHLAIRVNSQATLDLPYTKEECATKQKGDYFDVNFEGDEYPQWVHLKGEPADKRYPLMIDISDPEYPNERLAWFSHTDGGKQIMVNLIHVPSTQKDRY